MALANPWRWWILLGGLATCSACSSSSTAEPERIPDTVMACARLSACLDFEVDTFAGRLTGFDACLGGFGRDGASSAAPPASACVIAAADCDAVQRCVYIEPAAACPDVGARCDGDVLESCFAGLPLRRDCSAEGLSCIDNGNFVCGVETRCTASRCDGDRLFTCVGGEGPEVAHDCGPGLCRVDTESGWGRCLPSLETCDGSADFCDGDVAVRCRDGYAANVLCAPGACRETDGAFCATPERCLSTCDGATLLACAGGGRREAIDCTQWGSSGCVDDGSGARCAPL